MFPNGLQPVTLTIAGVFGKPAGKVSLKETPVKATGLGFVIVKVSVVVPPTEICVAPNSFLIFGGTIGALKAIVANSSGSIPTCVKTPAGVKVPNRL